jgi:hypothetical protein
MRTIPSTTSLLNPVVDNKDNNNDDGDLPYLRINAKYAQECHARNLTKHQAP